MTRRATHALGWLMVPLVSMASLGAAPDVARAASWEHSETADLLVRARADVNAANDLGITPLFLACANGNAVIAGMLLSAGATPNAASSVGVSPLMVAARTGSVAVVKALFAKEANVSAKETPRG